MGATEHFGSWNPNLRRSEERGAALEQTPNRVTLVTVVTRQAGDRGVVSVGLNPGADACIWSFDLAPATNCPLAAPLLELITSWNCLHCVPRLSPRPPSGGSLVHRPRWLVPTFTGATTILSSRFAIAIDLLILWWHFLCGFVPTVVLLRCYYGPATQQGW